MREILHAYNSDLIVKIIDESRIFIDKDYHNLHSVIAFVDNYDKEYLEKEKKVKDAEIAKPKTRSRIRSVSPQIEQFIIPRIHIIYGSIEIANHTAAICIIVCST